MAITQQGRHRAEHESWWARQSRGAKVAILTLALLLTGALTALALLIVTQLTAQENFQAKDIGNVNIGNAASEGVFPPDQSNFLLSLEPGESTGPRCVGVTVSNPQPGDDVRIYADSVSGVLAGHLNIVVEQLAVPGTGVGQVTCASFGAGVQVFSGTLSAWKAAQGTFANGVALLDDAGTQFRFNVSLPAGVDADAVKGQSASLVVAFENQN